MLAVFTFHNKLLQYMTKRTDIIDASEVYLADGSIRKYGLIYTRRCGWIDLGHANPAGAKSLWTDICRHTVSNACLRDPNAEVRITYSQSMKKFGMSAEESQAYLVKKQLTREEQKAIALAIFMNVSLAFEKMQSNWYYRHFTASGYSAEDLVSNVIGFYRALDPTYDYIKECEPVSKDQALAIWDTFGPVGENKNYQFQPLVYPNPLLSCGVPSLGKLPPKLNTIIPAVEGKKFRRVQ